MPFYYVLGDYAADILAADPFPAQGTNAAETAAWPEFQALIDAMVEGIVPVAAERDTQAVLIRSHMAIVGGNARLSLSVQRVTAAGHIAQIAASLSDKVTAR